MIAPETVLLSIWVLCNGRSRDWRIGHVIDNRSYVLLERRGATYNFSNFPICGIVDITVDVTVCDTDEYGSLEG